MQLLTSKPFATIVSCIIFLSGIFLLTADVGAKKERLVSLLTTYEAHDQKGPLQLSRQGRSNDGGYVVPVKALEASALLIGYGIADDPSFEVAFSETYHKPSFGFDCGIDHLDVKHTLFTFINECIGNDKFLYSDQISTQHVSSYTQHIKHFHLENKNIFIKMDIEGAEYQVFNDILKHAAHITGIVLEIHVDNFTLPQAIKLLSALKQQFLLLHVHGNNYAQLYFSSKNATGRIPQVLELTYINKSLVTGYQISKNQSHPLPIDMPNNANQKDVRFTIGKK
ncbi:MAG: FkbM family methyltransferase [Gammaproteobacteria bacterium]|nr:FkbM family methyltransferase [Gammaproteobacteria bacterium]